MGDPIDLSTMPHQVLGNRVLYEVAGEGGVATLSPSPAAVTKLVDDFWASIRAKVPSARRVSASDIPRGEALPLEDEKPVKAHVEEDDLPLLSGSIVYDEARERLRSMASAVAVAFEDEFPDLPIGGPRSLFVAIRELRLESENFLDHHQQWVMSSGLHKTDRAVHEHEVCCAALHRQLCLSRAHR